VRYVTYRGISFRKHYNISKKWIRELFDRAKESAPSIIFFDEFDSLTSVSTFPDTILKYYLLNGTAACSTRHFDE
jgi:hypothetical protein